MISSGKQKLNILLVSRSKHYFSCGDIYCSWRNKRTYDYSRCPYLLVFFCIYFLCTFTHLSLCFGKRPHPPVEGDKRNIVIVIIIITIIIIIMCRISMAYSMGHIIKSVCVCQSVCPSASTLTVAFPDRFSPKLEQSNRLRNPKSKNQFVEGQYRTTPFSILPPPKHFRPRGPENPWK